MTVTCFGKIPQKYSSTPPFQDHYFKDVFIATDFGGAGKSPLNSRTFLFCRVSLSSDMCPTASSYRVFVHLDMNHKHECSSAKQINTGKKSYFLLGSNQSLNRSHYFHARTYACVTCLQSKKKTNCLIWYFMQGVFHSSNKYQPQPFRIYTAKKLINNKKRLIVSLFAPAQCTEVQICSATFLYSALWDTLSELYWV